MNETFEGTTTAGKYEADVPGLFWRKSTVEGLYKPDDMFGSQTLPSIGAAALGDGAVTVALGLPARWQVFWNLTMFCVKI